MRPARPPFGNPRSAQRQFAKERRMSSAAKQPLSRRGALLAGTAVLVGGLGTADRTAAAVRPPETGRSPSAALTPTQRAGQRVIYSYLGAHAPGQAAGRDQRGPRGRGDLLRGEHREPEPDRGRGPGDERGERVRPRQGPTAPDDRPGGRYGAAKLPGEPVVSAKDVGASSDPAGQATYTGTGAGLNLAERRHERQPGAGARRLPHRR